MSKDLLFGIACIVAGIACLIKVIYERKTAVHLQGEISGYSQDGKGNYYPLVDFHYQGQDLTIPGANGSGKPKYEVGTAVEVLYRPSNQKYVNIAGSNSDIVYSIIFFVAGIGIVICKLLK